jgi:hypothetical protein
MIIMYILWMLIKRPGFNASPETSQSRRLWYNDLVDVNTVDLSKDEYQDVEDDRIEGETGQDRVTKGSFGTRTLWRLYYLVA